MKRIGEFGLAVFVLGIIMQLFAFISTYKKLLDEKERTAVLLEELEQCHENRLREINLYYQILDTLRTTQTDTLYVNTVRYGDKKDY